MIDGRRSLCRPELSPENGSLVTSELFRCIGGSSTEDLGLLSLSESETDSCALMSIYQCVAMGPALRWNMGSTHALGIPVRASRLIIM